MAQEHNIFDLTREEGARIYEKHHLGFRYAEQLQQIFKQATQKEPHGRSSEKEYYANNIFIDGQRGTGKTSVLLTFLETIAEDKKEDKKYDILSLLQFSTAYESIIVHILHHIRRTIERDPEKYSNSKIWDVLGKVEEGFPTYLKHLTNLNHQSDTSHPEDISELIARTSSTFLEDIQKLIRTYLQESNRDFLILVLDDIDMIHSDNILFRMFIEMSIFLNMKEVIIIGAGHEETLLHRMKSYIRKIYFNLDPKDTPVSDIREKVQHIIFSLIGKVFPLDKIVRLHPVTASDLATLRVKYKENEKEETLSFTDFLRRHPSFRFFLSSSKEESDQELAISLFNGFTPRELSQALLMLHRQIELISESKTEEYAQVPFVSEIFIRLFQSRHPQLGLLYLPTEPVRFYKNPFPQAYKDAIYHSWNAFVSFTRFIYKTLEQNGQLARYFHWNTITEYRDKRRIDIFSLIRTDYGNVFYNILHLWILELIIYSKGYLYFIPLWMIISEIFYGAPAIFQRLSPETSEEELFPPREFLVHFKGTISNINSLDDILTYYFISTFISFHGVKDNYRWIHSGKRLVQQFLSKEVRYTTVNFFTYYINMYKIFEILSESTISEELTAEECNTIQLKLESIFKNDVLWKYKLINIADVDESSDTSTSTNQLTQELPEWTIDKKFYISSSIAIVKIAYDMDKTISKKVYEILVSGDCRKSTAHQMFSVLHFDRNVNVINTYIKNGLYKKSENELRFKYSVGTIYPLIKLSIVIASIIKMNDDLSRKISNKLLNIVREWNNVVSDTEKAPMLRISSYKPKKPICANVNNINLPITISELSWVMDLITQKL